jgi:hypothetical protein
VATLPRHAGDERGVREPCREAIALVHIEQVGLVERQDLGDPARPDVVEDRVHRLDLPLHIRARRVRDVQDQVGARDLLQRGTERLDQVVR